MDSKLYLAFGKYDQKRYMCLAPNEEKVKDLFPFEVDNIKLAFQPDPKTFKVYDKINDTIHSHKDLTCILGRQFVKAPFIHLGSVRCIFIASQRFNNLYAMRVWGIGRQGQTLFHILTDEFRDRGMPYNEAKEILRWITGKEQPFDFIKIHQTESNVGRRKDLFNRDNQSGENCMRRMEDDINVFRYKNLRFSLVN